jgi:hypothetical protein
MTQPQSAFIPEEWEILGGGILQPAVAVAKASKGVSSGEMLAMYEAIAEQLKSYADNPLIQPLLDQVLSKKAADAVKAYEAKLPDEMVAMTLDTLRSALALLAEKSRPEVAAEYKRIVLNIAERVAGASNDRNAKGYEVSVNESEEEVLTLIREALGE